MSIKSIYFPFLSNYLCIFLNFHLLYRLIMPSHFISNHPSASRILSCLPFSFSLHLFPPLWSLHKRQKRILPYIAGFFSLLFIHFNRVKHFCDHSRAAFRRVPPPLRFRCRRFRDDAALPDRELRRRRLSYSQNRLLLWQTHQTSCVISCHASPPQVELA